ncbi:hypothetical protein M2366_003492 [Aeromonas sp. BIGb0405]|jgi:hypothetical protein|nr:hypothetical protein [Aeromonas sp. BIGb0405]
MSFKNDCILLVAEGYKSMTFKNNHIALIVEEGRRA